MDPHVFMQGHSEMRRISPALSLKEAAVTLRDVRALASDDLLSDRFFGKKMLDLPDVALFTTEPAVGPRRRAK